MYIYKYILTSVLSGINCSKRVNMKQSRFNETTLYTTTYAQYMFKCF